MRKIRTWLLVAGTLVALLGVVAWNQAPTIAAGGLLHPMRRPVVSSPPKGCADTTFPGAGLSLTGWRCTPEGSIRGTVVYLHGVADNRLSSVGVIDRFLKRGYEVIAYDSRAHGNSEGAYCTYGYYEKQDLRRVLDTTLARPVVLIGTSLGAAVALQAAAGDSRVVAIVAVETFSDLRTVARERAPAFLPGPIIERAFRVAEQQAAFVVDDVSPRVAAAAITVPVLLIHGAADKDTPPGHSQRVFEALKGPKKLILVEGAGHNESLNRPGIWTQVESWVAQVTGGGELK